MTAGVQPRSGPLLLATAAAVATIAHATAGGTRHPVVGVLIGLLWVVAVAAVGHDAVRRRAVAHERHLALLTGVIASGSPEAAAGAWVDMGVLLVRRGNRDGARVAFERAINSGMAEVVPMAAFNLGLLHSSSGDLEASIPAYRRAIDSGHPAFRPMSANNLGQTLQLLGRHEQARAAYRIAAGSGDPKQAAFAGRALAELGSEGPGRPGFRPPDGPARPER